MIKRESRIQFFAWLAAGLLVTCIALNMELNRAITMKRAVIRELDSFYTPRPIIADIVDTQKVKVAVDVRVQSPEIVAGPGVQIDYVNGLIIISNTQCPIEPEIQEIDTNEMPRGVVAGLMDTTRMQYNVSDTMPLMLMPDGLWWPDTVKIK